MCIMEIHPRQHTTTMVQAMTHNAKTLLSDLEMLKVVVASRDHGDDYCAALARAEREITDAHADLLLLYAHCLNDAVQADEVAGNERRAEDIRRARQYETR